MAVSLTMRYRVASQVGKRVKVNSWKLVQIRPRVILSEDAQFCIRALQILHGFDDDEAITYLLSSGSHYLKENLKSDLEGKVKEE